MGSREIKGAWAFKHGGRQRSIPARITFFRDTGWGKWFFHACINVGTPGKRSRQYGTGGTIDRTYVFKPGQHVCGKGSNPRLALAAAGRQLSKLVRKKRQGVFARYR